MYTSSSSSRDAALPFSSSSSSSSHHGSSFRPRRCSMMTLIASACAVAFILYAGMQIPMLDSLSTPQDYALTSLSALDCSQCQNTVPCPSTIIEHADQSPTPSNLQCPPVPKCPPAPSCPPPPPPPPPPSRTIEGREPVWDDEGYHYYVFRDMFFPYNKTLEGERSLVFFTCGRSAMENIDRLITLWGTRHFDYVLFHFDDSASEWNKFPWYNLSIGITVKRQAKFWYYKRFGAPWLVKGYRYIHFIDSDAGSPEEHPFYLRDYEDFLSEHRVLIGQPAISPKGRSSDHAICRVHDHTLLRWTTVVENGPLYSVSQEAYGCYWEMLGPNMVSGWGPDTAWCPYLYEVCGFPKEQSCAVVDVYYIDHLDKKTASGFKYRGKEYWQYGFDEWHAYEKTVGSLLKSEYQKTAGYFSTIKEVPKPPGWEPPPHLQPEMRVVERGR